MKLKPAHTAIVMGALVLLALVWEGMALGWGTNATISELVWKLSENSLFTFVMGMLMGHFFFVKAKCVHCGKFPYRKTK